MHNRTYFQQRSVMQQVQSEGVNRAKEPTADDIAEGDMVPTGNNDHQKSKSSTIKSNLLAEVASRKKPDAPSRAQFCRLNPIGQSSRQLTRKAFLKQTAQAYLKWFDDLDERLGKISSCSGSAALESLVSSYAMYLEAPPTKCNIGGHDEDIVEIEENKPLFGKIKIEDEMDETEPYPDAFDTYLRAKQNEFGELRKNINDNLNKNIQRRICNPGAVKKLIEDAKENLEKLSKMEYVAVERKKYLKEMKFGSISEMKKNIKDRIIEKFCNLLNEKGIKDSLSKKNDMAFAALNARDHEFLKLIIRMELNTNVRSSKKAERSGVGYGYRNPSLLMLAVENSDLESARILLESQDTDVHSNEILTKCGSGEPSHCTPLVMAEKKSSSTVYCAEIYELLSKRSNEKRAQRNLKEFNKNVSALQERPTLRNWTNVFLSTSHSNLFSRFFSRS